MCISHDLYKCSIAASTPWDRDLKGQFVEEGKLEYASCDRGDDKCTSALGIWVGSRSMDFVKATRFADDL